jgi:putative SOS response-associated peptidase YedK
MMCGRLNVIDSPEVIDLCGQLGISFKDKALRTGRFIQAASTVSVILEKSNRRTLQDATWWLLLEQTETGFKPSAYTSFNTRYDKLDVPRSAGYNSYRHQRCIIPVKGFGETEQVDGKAVYHDFTADKAIALGGLYKEWVHKATGEVVYSCSVITLPPHPKLMPYHSKASPLILPQSHYAAWLSPDTDSSQLNTLLTPKLCVDLTGVKVKKPSQPEPISREFRIACDEC